MVGKELIVTDVKWEEIPESLWDVLLREILVGHCVTGFPFDTWGNKRIKIAIPVNIVAISAAESHPDMLNELVIKYEQVMLLDDTIVWQRRK